MLYKERFAVARIAEDLHDRVQWVGLAAHNATDEKIIVSSRSTKQRAKDMALDGFDPIVIADRLERPVRLIRDWLEMELPSE